MKRQLTDQDYELISAYLDQQLTQKESASLEARINADRAVQDALEEMRQTRQLLRSLPKLRAPRNFTLTPEIVSPKKERGFQLFPTLRLSSALASLLLLIAFIGEFLLGSARLPAMMLAEAPAGESEGVEMSTMVLEGDTDDRAQQVESTLEEEMFGLMAPQASGEPEEQGLEVLAVPPAEFESEAEPGARGAAPEAEQAYPPSAKLVPHEDKTLPYGAGGGIIENEAASEIAVPKINPWRVAQIALAFLALTTGIAAWIVHRRSS